MLKKDSLFDYIVYSLVVLSVVLLLINVFYKGFQYYSSSKELKTDNYVPSFYDYTEYDHLVYIKLKNTITDNKNWEAEIRKALTEYFSIKHKDEHINIKSVLPLENGGVFIEYEIRD